MNLNEFREKYNAYYELSDGELANAIYRTYYKDKLSFENFSEQMGYDPTDRTVGESIKDIGVSAVGGVGNLLKIGGDLYGLATGDMENWASDHGQSVKDYWDERKSEGLKSAEKIRKQKIDAADGELAKAGTAFFETITSPALLTSFLGEQVPMLLPVGAAGRVAGAVTKAAGAGAKTTALAGTGAAILTAGGMQGTDAGSQAFEQLMVLPDEVWLANPDIKAGIEAGGDLETLKRTTALSLSQDAAIASGIVSVGLNAIPGARVLEKGLAGVKIPGKSRLTKAATGFVGETAQEAGEEAYGAYAAGVATREIDPSVDPMVGVGEAGGMGAAAGPFGAVAGALSPTEEAKAERPQIVKEVMSEPTIEEAANKAEEIITSASKDEEIIQQPTPDVLPGVTDVSLETTAMEREGVVDPSILSDLTLPETPSDAAGATQPAPDTITPTDFIPYEHVELTPEETQKLDTAQKKSQSAKKRYVEEVKPDPVKDDFLAAIAKRGGMSRLEAEANGIDPAEFKRTGWKIKRVFTNDGLGPDGLAELLTQDGYPVTDENGNYNANTFLDSLNKALAGERVMAIAGTDTVVEDMVAAQEDTMEQMDKLAGVTIDRQDQDFLLSDEEYEGLEDREDQHMMDIAEFASDQGLDEDIREAILEKGSIQGLSDNAIKHQLREASERTGITSAELNKAEPGQGSRTEAPTEPTEEVTIQPASEVPRVEAAFTNFLEKTAKKILMEEQGQGILDDMEEIDRTPVSVSKEFWKDTYPILNGKMQEKFNKYLTSLSGWTPGSVIATHPTEGNTIAKDWFDIADNMDLPQEVYYLEGTERGYVALMEWANIKNKGAQSVREKPAAPLLKPYTEEDLQTIQDEKAAKAEEVKTEEAKAKADEEVDQFALKGNETLKEKLHYLSVLLNEEGVESSIADSDIKNIINLADKHNETITARAAQKDLSTPDVDSLVDFYRKHGFTEGPTRWGWVTRSPKEQTMFSQSLQATGTQKGIAQKVVQDAIAPALAKVSDTIGLEVEVVATQNDLPKAVPAGIRPKGVFANNKIYLVAENITSIRDAQIALAHELVGHYGVINMSTAEEWTDIKDLINRLIKLKHKPTLDMLAEVDERYGEITEDKRIKELLAIAAELRVSDEGSLGKVMRQVREIITKFLKWMGLKGPFSNTEINLILSASERYLREGEGVQAEAIPALASQDAAMQGQPLFAQQKPLQTDTNDPSDPNILFSQDKPQESFQFSKSGREYTPEQAAAKEKGGFGKKPPIKAAGERWNNFRQNLGLKLRQGLVDQYASFKEVLKDPQSWMMANLSSSSNGVMEMMLENGSPELTKNVITINTEKKSLREVLEPLGKEMDDWLMWVAGNRANRLFAEGREHLFSEDDIKALMSLAAGKLENGESRRALYDNVRKDFEELNNAINQIAVDSGLLSAKEAETWAEQGFYLPFYRMVDDQANARGPRVFANGLVRQTAYKKLKGADMQIGDLLGNAMMNWNHLVGASLKNNAAVKALSQAEELGLAHKVSERTKSKDAVFVRWGGISVWYEIEGGPDGSLVLDSLISLNYDGLNTRTMKIARGFKRALTVGVTASPEFKAANLMRDTIQAIAVADMSTNIAKNLYQGWNATSKGNDAIIQMIAGGGAFGDSGYIHGADPDAIRYLVDKGVLRDNILTQRRLLKWWDKYQDFGARLENVNRAANFVQDIKGDKSLLEANFNARDHLDFSRTGSFVAIRALAQSVPFLNARLQGLDKLGRAAMDKNQRTQFTAVVGVYAMASVALYLAMKDDDDYKEAEEWERDIYHLFKLPNSDIMYRLPRPFEVGAIASTAERMVEQIVDDDAHGQLFAERLWHTITETFAFNPIPQVAKPILEVYSNKNSFTGRDIESLSMRLSNLPAKDRKRAWTSATAIEASGLMDKVTWGKVVLSPVQIEHLVKAYFGWAGTTVLENMDIVTRAITDSPKPPASHWTDYPLIKRFAREAEGRNSKYMTNFYDHINELNEIQASIKQAREWGDAEKALSLFEKNKDKLRWRKTYNRLRLKLSKIRKKGNRIHLDKDMSPDLKKLMLDRNRQDQKRLVKILEDRAGSDLK